MLRTLGLAAFLLLVPAAAFAHQCPVLMGEIDAALETASLSDADKSRVEELRTQGEELHSAGDHDASVAALQEAKGILGIE